MRGRVVTRVLLVTGARSLATRPGAEAWARGVIAEALAGVDLLIVGDAPGPDAWAAESVGRCLVGEEWRGNDAECHRYLTRGRDAGWIVASGGCEDSGEEEYVARWTRIVGGTTPLDRNAAMVRMAAEWRDRDADVRVLALLDALKPAGSTRGTEHTVELARRAGLTVVERVWPRDAARGE